MAQELNWLSSWVSFLARRDRVVLKIVKCLRLDESSPTAVDPEDRFIGIHPRSVRIADARSVLAPDDGHGIAISEMLAEDIVHFFVARHVEEAVDHAIRLE